MNLSSESHTQTPDAGLESVQSPAKLHRRRFWSALQAPMFWKTGLQPGLSRFQGSRSLVGREHAPPG
jgi:hypothetical protein